MANNSNTTYKLIQHTEPHVYLHMSFSSSVTPEDSCGRWEAACRIKQVLDSYMYMYKSFDSPEARVDWVGG